MNYKIIDGKRFLNVILEILNNKYDALGDLFFTVSLRHYPKLIDGALNGFGIGINECGINFPGDYDNPEDRIPENKVFLYGPDRELLMERMEYLEVLLEMSKATLQRQQSTKDVDVHWTLQMEEGIKKLEEYIKNPDFKV